MSDGRPFFNNSKIMNKHEKSNEARMTELSDPLYFVDDPDVLNTEGMQNKSNEEVINHILNTLNKKNRGATIKITTTPKNRNSSSIFVPKSD